MSLFKIAEEPERDESEAGRKLFAGSCEFVKGVVAMDGLPPGDRPEICFAGRSNVGKSSLINALTGRKGLARASNTPGRTQELNFFDLASGALWLVDLPGYGFAEAPVHIVAQWQALLKTYLSGRASLRRAYVLIDSRHGVKKVDHEIMDLLDTAAVSFQVVMTKADKMKPGALAKVVDGVGEALKKHPTAYPEIIVTSSEKGAGVPVLRAAIAQLLAE